MRKLLLLIGILSIGLWAEAQLGPTTFNFTGQVQTYTVPPCVTQLQVVVRGAKGGGTNGGNGSQLTGTLNVTAGQVLEIRVGGQGTLGNNSAGFNGGGTGHAASNAAWHSGGGGGASDIRTTPYALNNRIVVAAGGGGRGGGSDAVGGAFAACPNGQQGSNTYGTGGSGGTQTAGGAGGTPWAGTPPGGTAGTLGVGGQGGLWGTASGGGGGGGLYGGGGGGNDGCCTGANGGGGGGSGSSLVPVGFTCTQNIGTGNGLITITPIGGMILAVSPAAPNICEGQSVDLTISGGESYEWIASPSLSTTTGATSTATPPVTETFGIIGTLGACVDTAFVTVNVIAYPVLAFIPPNPSGCGGEQVPITVVGAAQYTWSPGTGLNTTTGPTVVATVDETTTYTVTGTISGCSTTQTVTVSASVTVNEAEQICNGQTFTLADGTVVSEGGDYTTVLTTVLGCDSIINVALTQNPTYLLDNPIQICQGENYLLPNGQSVNQSGTYPVLLSTNGAGCDSTITTVLTVNPLLSSAQSPQICQGELFTLPNGQTISAPGTYNTVLSSLVTGCDSTVTTTLTVNPNFNQTLNPTPCANQTYIMPDGQTATNSGTFTYNFQSIAGCDSTVVVNLNINPVYNLNFNQGICQGQSFTLPNGNNVSASGTYVSNLTTMAGCDSVITVQLTVNPLPNLNLGLASSYCPYQLSVPISPTPAGGQLTGTTVQGLTLNHNGVNPGNYTVNYAFTDGNGCSSTTSGSYVLAPPVAPSFSYNLFCSELQMFNTTADPNGVLNYRWTLGNEEISTQNSPTYLYEENGLFDLTLTATDNFNCTYSSTQSVDLQQTLDLTGFYIPNVITPNDDGINDTLTILPIVTECLEYSLQIFNRWGQLVYEMKQGEPLFAGKKSNGDELESGQYYYVFSGGRLDCATTPEFKKWCSGMLMIKRD